MKVKLLSRTVWVLALVSLFADIASEMLYPIMPVYLRSIGFSVLLIGVLEGMAQATAGLSKGYFGRLSDRTGRRLPFIRWGYLLAAVSKPLLALSSLPLWVFGARTLDRFGKGLRTGARDALLSDEATPQTKGRVFGFHRAMDTLGACIGPGIALLYLYLNPGQYTLLFYLAFLPGLASVLLLYLLREKRRPAKVSTGGSKYNFLEFLRYWRESPAAYRRLLLGLLLFALFNSSDFFLLLRMKEAGMDDTHVIGLYLFYNLVYALSSFPMGIAADKWGLKPVYLTGLGLFAAVYLGMALAQRMEVYLALIFVYGLFAAATEGVSKAWLTNICAPKDTATAIGTYTAFESIATLGASALAGLLWQLYGPAATFAASGILAILVVLYLAFSVKSPSARSSSS
ncbi:MFS-type transporter involved in bile tolerance (Atg22 family) [Pontibacter mucosus]|uniref:MFS-type transporter involved in bile tolerance (Atg22 family) n=1 Tax=Pontibacter mucosus TaxID=1649266 RepID=A0A2T5Y531_9BACT|nr:MFS transporter [Pontibacter mucosus]PTX11392.1 MFS-type transporter involved in bile tolerance (Atg22 family) [Pontibacter mucosus]